MPDFDMDMRVTVQLSPNWRTLESEIKQATEIAARHVEAGAKDRIRGGVIPEDRAVDTGTTMNTINARRDDAEGLSWRIGPSTEYAPFIEYGTIYMRARPFMTPALETEAPRFVEAMRQLLNMLNQAPPGSVRLV